MTKTKQKPAFTPKEGLLSYYSSQADMLLAQYENINHLLGRTNDWTGPGMHCEVLLRDFLRKVLPPSIGVHKGFVYGDIDAEDQSGHCPEIDILLHDTLHFAPVFQIDDFVIVQPKAARAVIQVKRVMQASQLGKALRNIKKAKEYILKHSPSNAYQVFSGAVFFEDRHPGKAGHLPSTYSTSLRKLFANPNTWAYAPDFVGSLKHTVLYQGNFPLKLDFVGGPAIHKTHNISLQVLLAQLCRTCFTTAQHFELPFAFPDNRLPCSYRIPLT